MEITFNPTPSVIAPGPITLEGPRLGNAPIPSPNLANSGRLGSLSLLIKKSLILALDGVNKGGNVLLVVVFVLSKNEDIEEPNLVLFCACCSLLLFSADCA